MTEWLFFDCMETLVDMQPIPKQEDYASWHFHGSGVEGLWNSFDSFFESFQRADESLRNKLPLHKEWSISDRLEIICRKNRNINEKDDGRVQKLLYNNYNANYYSKCFVRKDVLDVLPLLSGRYRLGVVSNFKILMGIETILNNLNIRQFFNFVVTSTEVGWRKPHLMIYEAALSHVDCGRHQILFIGDDYHNDVETPLNLGMKAVWLTRDGNNGSQKNGIRTFHELEKIQLTLRDWVQAKTISRPEGTKLHYKWSYKNNFNNLSAKVPKTPDILRIDYVK